VYQVFALKYRPKNFDEIIGQPHITQTLKNEIKHLRIANAYLFAGPRGIGKTTTARIVAKALNCVNGPTTEPCNSCEQCREIQRGSSLDVLEIDGASNRGIDEVRQLREGIKYAPTHGRYKIYIIDEVHMLTQEAFNALLKTIEEPPKHVVFIFATTAPYKLPLTILSRCQRFNFRKISPLSISNRIKTIAQLEAVEIEDSACSLIANLVDGAMRDAISILDQLIPYSEGKIRVEDVQFLLGLPPETLLFKLTDAIIKRDANSILITTQDALDQGISTTELLSGLIRHLETLFFIKTGMPTEEKQAYASQAKLFETSHILRLINFLFDTEKDMRGVLSKEIYLAQALVRASICTQFPIEKILEQLESKEREGFSYEIKETKEFKENRALVQPKKEEKKLDLPQLWKMVCEKLDLPLGSIAAQAIPIKLTQKKLFIQCKNEFLKAKIKEKLDIIEREIKNIIHKDLSIEFESPEKKKKLIEEPIVQKAIEIFNAEVSNVKRY
jgi:DNA polymerase-3 subunit gamma/tau